MCCHELSRNVSRPVMCLMSASDITTLAALVTNHNKIYREYKVIRESITDHTMGPWPRLTLTLLLKYLAQCETINYVWYFQERVWPGWCTYLPRAARNSTCWSVNFQKAIDTNLCEGSEHYSQLTTVHMKYDSNKLQWNHFYMCNIDIIAQCNIFRVPT